MLRIIIDPKPMVSQEFVRYQMRETAKRMSGNPLYYVPGGTLALVPGWCEHCNNERAWITIGGDGMCAPCRKKIGRRAGFNA